MLTVIERDQDTAITSTESNSWTDEQLDIIKSQIAKGCSDSELVLFGQVCKKTGLDPFTRQIYAISRNVWNPDTRRKEPKMTIQVSIDGFRTIAARSGRYGGSKTYWCGEDGIWIDVWLSSRAPAAAKTEVWRVGSPMPFVAVARFASYAQVSHEGKLTGLWEKMPDTMIGKCSESLALRKAFPAELSGLYSSEEVQQADNTAYQAHPVDEPVKAIAPVDPLIEIKRDVVAAMKLLKWEQPQIDEWVTTYFGGRSNKEWSTEDWQKARTMLSLLIDQDLEA
jgi:phage recombination protein Bet